MAIILNMEGFERKMSRPMVTHILRLCKKKKRLTMYIISNKNGKWEFIKPTPDCWDMDEDDAKNDSIWSMSD